MCIYYNSIEKLNYNSQEHIIPAAIGGINKLPLGYVSDEFNNDISKLEQEFIRESLISIPRQFDGPGKRGRMGLNHASKSKILLIEDKSKQILSLGYMQRGKSYEIPFLEVNLDTGLNQLHVPTNEIGKAHEVIDTFTQHTQLAETLKIKRVEDKRIAINSIFIGIQNGVEENFNCFIFKNPMTVFNFLPDTIKALLENLDFKKDIPIKKNYMPEITQSVIYKEEHLRIYGKIAFNFFASLLGIEVARLEIFDNVRDWITGRSNKSHAYLDLKGNDPFVNTTPIISKKNHTILISQSQNQLVARVSIYGLPAKVLLSDNFTNSIPPCGMICDWENRNEYGLGEIKFNN